jgi:hypothetical protein
MTGMKKHKLYLTDAFGNYSDRIAVSVDPVHGILRVGHKLHIPLADILEVQLRQSEGKRKKLLVAIDFATPSIENGQLTTVRLIHVDFLTRQLTPPLQALINELTPLIGSAAAGNFLRSPDKDVRSSGLMQAQYALNVSLAIAYHRRLWFSYDRPALIAWKSIGLMLLGGAINWFGVLIVAVPFDNYQMSLNLRNIGWSKPISLMVYLVLTYPAPTFWTVKLVRWLTKTEA